MNKDIFTIRLKIAREFRGITMEDLAERVGLNKSTIQRYSGGKIERPKTVVIKSFAEELWVDPDWLCGEPDTVAVPGDQVESEYLYTMEIVELRKRRARGGRA